MGDGKGTVCVTGGTGFIASSLIKRLLQEGYSVNTTVRSHPDQKKDVSFLTNLPGADQKLKIFNADLRNPESFNAAIEGCIGVFHVATPVDFHGVEPVEVVTKTSMDGALGILKASLDSKTVKRVVYTSSIGASLFNGTEDEVLDESYWSDVDYLRAEKPYSWTYGVSKTLTEKAALEFGEKNGLEVVTVVLPFVIGPFICAKLPEALGMALSLIFGGDKIKEHDLILHRTPLAHVDDVTRAYIFLLEHPNSKGRYNISSHVMTFQEIHHLLSAKYPECKKPTLEELKVMDGYKIPALSSKKLTDAGFEFKYGIDEMFDDSIRCCKENGYL